MGWLACTGGLARTAGPMYVTYLFKHFGVRWTAIGVNAIILFIALLLIFTWKRIVPYDQCHPKDAISEVITNTAALPEGPDISYTNCIVESSVV